MRARESLKKRFDERLSRSAINTAIEINDAGLVFGAGTVLARMRRDACGASRLDLYADWQRMATLLAAAYGRPLSPDVFLHIEGAFEQWRRGDKALANIRLAFARLPRLEDHSSVTRLFHAEDLLERGVSPRPLMLAFGFAPEVADLAKYDPNEPRVPAGSGRSSGQWTSGAAGSQQSAEAASPGPTISATAAVMGAASEHGTLAEALFVAVTSSEFLTGLAALGSAVGAASVLGTIFVPWQNRPFVEGPIPGDPALRYALDNDVRYPSLPSSNSGGRRGRCRRAQWP